jgi:hypothetical protein
MRAIMLKLYSNSWKCMIFRKVPQDVSLQLISYKSAIVDTCADDSKAFTRRWLTKINCIFFLFFFSRSNLRGPSDRDFFSTLDSINNTFFFYQAAAVMGVSVGAFSDPEGINGLAHFLGKSFSRKFPPIAHCYQLWLYIQWKKYIAYIRWEWNYEK